MQSAIIVFPGSNCDRDLKVALEQTSGRTPHMVWHKETELPKGIDLVAIPGGFSFGDYLRCGAIAARAPIMQSVVKFAQSGGQVMGICNGFQVLLETGLLPGALMRNANLKYICKDVALKVETTKSAFTSAYNQGERITVPIAHHDGNYLADDELLKELRNEERIAFTYEDNPNGSVGDIAGILSQNRRILGMMPHPERLNDPALGGVDGAKLFKGLMGSLERA
jgi:phosphoribosylformylglycinamidine synthase